MDDDFFEDFRVQYPIKGSVSLKGNQQLDLPSIISVARFGTKINLDLSPQKKDLFNDVIHNMLKQVTSGVPIYGTTTSYGARAKLVLNKGDEQVRILNATKLSESVIHVDVSTGPLLPNDVVRAAMLIRINMLLMGVSGIRIQTLETLAKLLNLNISPLVGQYGSVGASGDLAQNGRVLSFLLQRREVEVLDREGKVHKAKKLLKKLGINPISLAPKEGLALVNGDNFSSANCLLLTYDTACLMLANLGVVALIIQALKGSDRNFHPFLSVVRPHKGQKFISDILRKLLKDSQLAHQEMLGHVPREEGQSVQDPYSIRCLPQFYDPDWEALIGIWNTLKINVNSVSDNPLWVTPGNTTEKEEAYQWVSGGNFLAMHMSESLDRLRKILIHIVKQNDRSLSLLVHPSFNRGLPANLSDRSAISQATFKGLQTQMGMFDVYSNLLVTPASTAFGTHEEFNQDLTSHAPASSILARELIRIAKLAIATNFIAACQAIDLRNGSRQLSPLTFPFYDWLRKKVPYVKKEQPLGHYVERIANSLDDISLTAPILNLF